MPDDEPDTVNLDAMRCACGETILNVGDDVPTGRDARVTCAACGRGFVVTVTEFRGPQ